MSNPKSPYRKSALERLASVDQLDKAIVITSPLSWLALLSVTVIIAVTLCWSIVGTLPSTVAAQGVIVSATTSTNTILATAAGTVQEIVGADRPVYMDDPVLRLVHDSVEKTYAAGQVGVVSEVLVRPGDQVTQGTEILRIRPMVSAGQEQVVVCYVPMASIDKIRRGMKVNVSLTSAQSNQYGHMTGRVINVDPWATSSGAFAAVLGENNSMSSTFTSNGSVCAVTCELTPDASSASGYYWSNEKGRQLTLSGKAMCQVKIITEEVAPITKLFSELKDIWENSK